MCSSILLFCWNMFRKHLNVLSVFIVIGSIIISCKKEEKVEIQITNLTTITDWSEGDTLNIEYSFSGRGLDSICLVIDNNVIQTQVVPRNIFKYLPDRSGAYAFELFLIAYYNSGLIRTTKTYYVNISNLITPPLDFIVTRDDGLPTYFVGEKLVLTVVARFSTDTLRKEFKEITLYLNGDSLGTRKTPPYAFLTKEIRTEKNLVKVALKDKNNRIHHVDQQLDIPLNQSPAVQLSYGYRHNIQPGTYFTTEAVTLEVSASDNLKIHYIDNYFDNSYYSTDTINLEVMNFKQIPLGNLTAGYHEFYCIAYDDRGKSTISSVLPVKVYSTYITDSNISDYEYSGSANMAFMLSASQLYLIDPVQEQLSKVIDLPYQDAVAISFATGENNLYIAFKQGKLISWNIDNQTFFEVPLTNISKLEDIAACSNNRMMMISNHDLLMADLSTGEIVRNNIYLDSGSSLTVDSQKNLVIAGGNPQSSSGYVFVSQIGVDTLINIKSADIGGYAPKILVNPWKNELLNLCGSPSYITGMSAYNEITLEYAGSYSFLYSAAGSYSLDGNYLYLGADFEGNIETFNTDNRNKINSYPVPIPDNEAAKFIFPDLSGTKLVVVTRNIFNPGGRFFFMNLSM